MIKFPYRGDKLAWKGLARKGLAEGDQESSIAHTAMKIHTKNLYLSFTKNSHRDARRFMNLWHP